MRATAAAGRVVARDRDVQAWALLGGDSRRSRLAQRLLRIAPAWVGALALRGRRTGLEADERIARLLEGADPRRVVVMSGQRATTVACWPVRGAEPLGFVKFGDVDAEAGKLERIAPGAARHGVAVPHLEGREPGAFATAALSGVRAVAHVRGDDRRTRAVVAALAEWSHRWAVAEAGLGARAPAHRDLTAWNVLVRSGGLGILDWEEAVADAPVGIDVPYAVVDLVAARDGYADRVAAFRRCFGPRATSADAALARAALAPFAVTFGPDAVARGFHACWQLHAANERAKGVGAGPFGAIAAEIAADPGAYPFG